MHYSDSRFLKVGGIFYDEMGARVYLGVTRTTVKVTVTGTVNNGPSKPDGVSFQASIDPCEQSIDVGEGLRVGRSGVNAFIKACGIAQEMMELFSEDLENYQHSERFYLRALETECENTLNSNPILLLVAIRPVNMSEGGLREVVRLIAPAMLSDKPDNKTLKDHLENGMDFWRHEVLSNLMHEAGIGGTPGEIEKRLLSFTQKIEAVSGTS